MTKKRNDSHSTEFGLWLREQKEIDSALGYVATNLDYVWSNYKTGEWMLIEEKRYGMQPSYCQRQLLKQLHSACVGAQGYRGIHLLVFEHTSPDDGAIWLDRRQVTRPELLAFLRFEDGL